MRIISSQSFFLYAARPTVISTGTKQSGVEWRNLRSQWHQCLPLPLSFRPQRSKAEWSGEISGLNGTSASPPTVISTATEQSGVEWSGEISAPMAPVPPPPTVISTGTEQSGVEWSGEISGPNGTAPLRWEISRLKASMEFKYLDLPADTQPHSR